MPRSWPDDRCADRGARGLGAGELVHDDPFAGVVAALLVFVRSLHRSLVRVRTTAAQLPSRRIYPPALEAALPKIEAALDVRLDRERLRPLDAETLDEAIRRLAVLRG